MPQVKSLKNTTAVPVDADDWKDVDPPDADDWKDVEPPKALPTPVLQSATEASLRGLGQGVTFGFSDEGTAAMRALLAPGKFGETYPKLREEERQKLAKAREAHPLAYTGSEMAGAIGTSFLPGGALLNVAKGAKLGVGLGKAGAAGALTGAGLSEKDPIASYQGAKDFAGDVATGAAWGAGTQGVLGGFGKVAGKAKDYVTGTVPDKLKKFAEERAVKAAGAMTKEMRDLENTGRVHKVGRELLDRKIVTPGATVEVVKDRARDASDKIGKEIGAALDTVDNFVKDAEDLISKDPRVAAMPPAHQEALKQKIRDSYQFNNQTVANRIRTDIIAPNADNPLLAKEMKKLEKLAQGFEENGAVSLRKGNVYKGTQRKVTKFGSGTLPDAFKTEVYTLLKEELDNAVGRTEELHAAIKGLKAGPKVGNLLGDGTAEAAQAMDDEAIAEAGTALKKYQTDKRAYGNVEQAEQIAKKRLGMERSNNRISLTDTIMAGAGFGAGAAGGGDTSDSALTGILLGALNKGKRTYGNPVAAVAADRLSESLRASPEAITRAFSGRWGQILDKAAREGNKALAVTHAVLMQRDPEYRKLMEEGEARAP